MLIYHFASNELPRMLMEQSEGLCIPLVEKWSGKTEVRLADLAGLGEELV